MKNKAKSVMATVSIVLLVSAAFPTFLIGNVNADDFGQIPGVEVDLFDNGFWWRIKTDFITILFPAHGSKPMFLWWYNNDTNNIYVVKYKGLVEYMTVEQSYYLRRYQAEALKIQERLEEKYVGKGLALGHLQQIIRARIRAHMQAESMFMNPAFLPFNACAWNLTGPENVTRPDGVSYISFNFTLERAPPRFSFAEGNVIICARFYGAEANETVHDGLYNYTVHAGELKMDLVIRNWEWNMDRLKELFDDLEDLGLAVPKMRTSLALWADLASINITDMPVAELDANSTLDSDLVEGVSKTSDIIVGGQRVGVGENRVAMDDDEAPIRDRIRERFRLRFAKGSQTLAGFFDFVDKALVINETSGEATPVDVTAAYISAGKHMRVFIGYPYFGSNTLEHDPSIGVEGTTTWLPTGLLMILIGATVLVAVAVSAIKLRKKTVNIVSLK